MDRRDFVTGLIGVGALAASPLEQGAAAQQPWKSGSIEHLLPTVSDRRLLLKVSFNRPLRTTYLDLGEHRVAGERTDTDGRFFEFDARDLKPGRTYPP